MKKFNLYFAAFLFMWGTTYSSLSLAAMDVIEDLRDDLEDAIIANDQVSLVSVLESIPEEIRSTILNDAQYAGGRIPLVRAALHGHIDIINLLVQHGARLLSEEQIAELQHLSMQSAVYSREHALRRDEAIEKLVKLSRAVDETDDEGYDLIEEQARQEEGPKPHGAPERSADESSSLDDDDFVFVEEQAYPREEPERGTFNLQDLTKFIQEGMLRSLH